MEIIKRDGRSQSYRPETIREADRMAFASENGTAPENVLLGITQPAISFTAANTRADENFAAALRNALTTPKRSTAFWPGYSAIFRARATGWTGWRKDSRPF